MCISTIFGKSLDNLMSIMYTISGAQDHARTAQHSGKWERRLHMKKYETPELELVQSKRATFLEISGEALGFDIFEDDFGQKFDRFS